MVVTTTIIIMLGHVMGVTRASLRKHCLYDVEASFFGSVSSVDIQPAFLRMVASAPSGGLWPVTCCTLYVVGCSCRKLSIIFKRERMQDDPRRQIDTLCSD
jgi:hypothetical protein